MSVARPCPEPDPSWARHASCYEPLTKLKVMAGGTGPQDDPCGRGRGEEHPTGAVRSGIEQRVRRAAQRRRLPGVSHNMREGAARAETRQGAALPALVRPPVEQRPPHQRCPQVSGRRGVHEETCRGDGGRRSGGSGGRRRRRRPGKGATGGPLEDDDGLLASGHGQVVQRLPRVAGRAAAGPAHQHVRLAVAQLEPQSSCTLCSCPPSALGTGGGGPASPPRLSGRRR